MIVADITVHARISFFLSWRSYLTSTLAYRVRLLHSYYYYYFCFSFLTRSLFFFYATPHWDYSAPGLVRFPFSLSSPYLRSNIPCFLSDFLPLIFCCLLVLSSSPRSMFMLSFLRLSWRATIHVSTFLLFF